MDHRGGAAGTIGAVMSTIVGAVLFIIALGTLIAIIFLTLSVASVSASALVLGSQDRVNVTKLLAASGTFVAIVLLATEVVMA